MSSLLAPITRVPTRPSLSSEDSIAISSSCCWSSTLTAGPVTSRASVIVFFSELRVALRWLIDSIAWMMSAFWSSRVPTTSSSDPSRSRSRPVRPSITWLSSWVMVPSWADAAAAEQEGQRAEHLLDLGVAAGVGERDRVAVATAARWAPRRSAARGRRTSRRAGSPGGSSATALSGSTTSSRTRRVTWACQPDALDLGDLADGHVVDHDRRLRDDVEDVGELRRHVVGVVGVDRRARAAAGRRRRRTCSRSPAGRGPRAARTSARRGSRPAAHQAALSVAGPEPA